MKRWAPVVAAVLLLMACGGGSSSSSTPPPKTPTPAPTPSPTPTPTVDPMAVAALFEGTYAGTWNNATYGTSGTARFDNKLDRAAGTMTTTLTLGGNVFGSPAPPPETYTYKVTAPGTGFLLKSATFGDVTVTFNPPSFKIDATNMSSPNVSAFSATGTITDPRTISMDYTVTMRAGGTATGKVSLSKQA